MKASGQCQGAKGTGIGSRGETEKDPHFSFSEFPAVNDFPTLVQRLFDRLQTHSNYSLSASGPLSM